MPRFTQFTLASSALLGFVSAQSTSVTQIFFPAADSQPLDASIIAQSAGATTILMNCAPDTPSDECGFPTPITLTVGPSTLHYEPSGIYQVLGSIDCKITASSVADCTVATGIYSDSLPTASQTDDAYETTPAASSSTTSDILSGTDVSWLQVTITAGLEKAAGAATSTGSVSTTGSGSSTGTATSASRTGATTGTGTGTSSSTAATASGNVAAGPSQNPYTALGVAAVLVAGSMMML